MQEGVHNVTKKKEKGRKREREKERDMIYIIQKVNIQKKEEYKQQRMWYFLNITKEFLQDTINTILDYSLEILFTGIVID